MFDPLLDNLCLLLKLKLLLKKMFSLGQINPIKLTCIIGMTAIVSNTITKKPDRVIIKVIIPPIFLFELCNKKNKDMKAIKLKSKIPKIDKLSASQIEFVPSFKRKFN